MKNVAVALAVSFAMLSAGFAFLLYRGGSPDDTEARADRQEIRGKLEDLAAAHGIDRPAGPAEPAAKGEAEGGGSEGPAARDAPAPTVVSAREALAAGDPGKTDSLREFVSQVIRQERDERQRRQAAEAQAP